MNEPKSSYWVRAAVAVLLGLGILVLVNYVGWKRYRRFDWTSANLYSLSEKTVKVLKDLKTDVAVTVFMTEGTPVFRETQEILKRYGAETTHLKVETIDPTRNRARAEQLVKEFGVTGASVVFKSGERKKHVSSDQLAEYDYSRARMGGDPTVKSFRGEQEFTSAILSVTQSRTPKVLFTTGHGERKKDDRDRGGFYALAESLRRDNCVVEEWGSLGAPDVPDGTDLLVVAGPTSAFTEPEVQAIRRYLDGGGRALLFVDAQFSPANAGAMLDLGLRPLLSGLGVTLDDDVVVDPSNAVPGLGAETVFARSFKPHPITKVLEGGAVVFPLARSVTPAATPPAGWSVTTLVETSADGWGEVDLKNLEVKVAKDDKDVKGPVSLAVALERGAAPPPPADAPPAAAASEKKSRLVVFGDADFASNGFVVNSANLYLLTASANWALEREALVSIPPKSTDQVAITLQAGDLWAIFVFVVLVLPILAVCLGLAVYFKRRR